MEDAWRGERGHGRVDRPLCGVDCPRRRDHPRGGEGGTGPIGWSSRRTRSLAFFLFARSFPSATSSTSAPTFDAEPLAASSSIAASPTHAGARTPSRAHEAPAIGIPPPSSSHQHHAALPRSLLRTLSERSSLPPRRPSRRSSSPARPARPAVPAARPSVPTTSSLATRSPSATRAVPSSFPSWSSGPISSVAA